MATREAARRPLQEARAVARPDAVASEDVGLVPLRRAWARAPQVVWEELGA